jgi:O-antigen biosynthesis protein WbqP
MIRVFDVLLAILGLTLGLPLLLIILIVGYLDTGSPLFRQVRVGRHCQPFILLKFRTMRLDAASVPTHLADTSSVTTFGRVLRRSKLDELPQLWNVLKGEMSLVGPRPCLFTQEELIAEREIRGVFSVRPGITGFSQIQGIDMSTPHLLAQTDQSMLKSLNLRTYFKCVLKTLMGSGRGDRLK